MKPLTKTGVEGRVEETVFTVPLLTRVSVHAAFAVALCFPLLLGGRLNAMAEPVKALCYLPGIVLASVLLLNKPTGLGIFSARIFSPPLRLVGLLSGIFILIVTIQLIPLPHAVLELVSPEAARVYSRSSNSFGFISLQPALTRASLSWVISLLIFAAWFVYVPRTVSNKELVVKRKTKGGLRVRTYKFETDYVNRAFQRAILSSGVLAACVAISHQLLRAESLFGLINIEHNEFRAHFPFVNPNHSAVMMEITFVIAVGKLLQLLEVRRKYGVETFREIIAHAGAALLALAAVFLSVSRVGIVLSLTGAAALLAFYFLHRSKTYSKTAATQSGLIDRSSSSLEQRFILWLSGFGIALLVVLVLMVLLGESGRETVQLRFVRGAAEGVDLVRSGLSEATLNALAQYRIFGSGLGCWHLAVAAYISEDLAYLRLDYAHNEFLQLLLEVGLLGFLPVIAGAFTVMIAGIRAWRNTKTYLSRLELTTIGAALLLPLLHSLFDFPFHIPALAYIYVMLLAVFLRIVDRAEEYP